MKRYFILLAILCLIVVSCHPTEQPKDEPLQTDTGSRLENLLLVDGAEKNSLLLAENNSENSGSIYTAGITSETSVEIDGKTATVNDLKNGMILTILHQGPIAESFPMQIMDIRHIKAITPPKEEYPDLCGFYLKVMDDLWQEDKALNGETVGFDFSRLPGNLSPAAKSALAIRFGELHGVNTVIGTMDSLKQEGYITKYGWSDGCLIQIEPVNETTSTQNDNGILNFNATKWKGPRGALYWLDCAAEWTKDIGFPTYTIGHKSAS